MAPSSQRGRLPVIIRQDSGAISGDGPDVGVAKGEPMGVEVGEIVRVVGVRDGVAVKGGMRVRVGVVVGVVIGAPGFNEPPKESVAKGVAVGRGVTRCAIIVIPNSLAKSCKRNCPAMRTRSHINASASTC
jgi:hypothetical protein